MGCSRPVGRPTCAEKTLEKIGGSLGEHTRNTDDAVVERTVDTDRVFRLHPTALWIVGGPDDALDSGIDQRTSTHGARLERDVHRRTEEPPVTDGCCCTPQSHDLGMRRWVAGSLPLVVTNGEDAPRRIHDDTPYWHVVVMGGSLGLGEREGHTETINIKGWERLVHSAERPRARRSERVAAAPADVEEVDRYRPIMQDHHGIAFGNDECEPFDLLLAIALSRLVQSQPDPGTTSAKALKHEPYRFALGSGGAQILLELLERSR